MAQVQARRHKQVVPETVQKKDRAPAKEKNTVSLLGMFGFGKKQEYRSVLSPGFSGVAKSKAKQGSTAPSVKVPQSAKTTVYQPGFFKQFIDPIGVYAEAADANFEHRMAQWRKELDNRKNGLDLKGNPIRKAPVPTREDIEALRKEIEEINKPIDEEVLHIEDKTTGGTKVQRLADSREILRRREQTKMAQINEFEKEQKRVDDEIEKLKKEVLGESEEAVTAKQEHEAQIAALQKEIEKVEAKAKKELDEMRRKGRKAKDAFNLKIQALWEGINDDD